MEGTELPWGFKEGDTNSGLPNGGLSERLQEDGRTLGLKSEAGFSW